MRPGKWFSRRRNKSIPPGRATPQTFSAGKWIGNGSPWHAAKLLLLQDAQGLFCQQQLGCWVDEKSQRTTRYWDEEGFTSCEGVKQPLRVLRTEETVRRRERIAGQWHETNETTTWSWATTLSKTQWSTRGL